MMITVSTSATTPSPPDYAVVSASQRASFDPDCDFLAACMIELAARRPDYLGVESVRAAGGLGMTIPCCATSESAIAGCEPQVEHAAAREGDRHDGYRRYRDRVALVERDCGGPPPIGEAGP